jgi:hypothetical protein
MMKARNERDMKRTYEKKRRNRNIEDEENRIDQRSRFKL